MQGNGWRKQNLDSDRRIQPISKEVALSTDVFWWKHLSTMYYAGQGKQIVYFNISLNGKKPIISWAVVTTNQLPSSSKEAHRISVLFLMFPCGLFLAWLWGLSFIPPFATPMSWSHCFFYWDDPSNFRIMASIVVWNMSTENMFWSFLVEKSSKNSPQHTPSYA